MTNLEYLRHFRFEGYAIFDIVVSFLGMYLLSGLLSKLFLKIGVVIPKISWIYWTLPLGIIFHIVFGQMTPMTKEFLNPSGGYIVKVLILTLLGLGFYGVKIVSK